eukprot:s2094_g6.t2
MLVKFEQHGWIPEAVARMDTAFDVTFSLGRSDGAVRNIAHFGNHLCLKAHQPLEKSLRLTESIPDGKCKAQGEARDVSNHDPTIVHLPLLAQVSVLRGIRATEGAFWLKTDLVAGSVGSQKV